MPMYELWRGQNNRLRHAAVGQGRQREKCRLSEVSCGYSYLMVGFCSGDQPALVLDGNGVDVGVRKWV